MTGRGPRAGYRIADEPQPGALAKHAVDPFWPLLSYMLAGAWFGTLWFGFNAFAMGSASKKRELWMLGLGMAAAAAVIAIILGLGAAGVIDKQAARYAVIAVPVAKLCFAYVVYGLQARSFELFRYFGGEPRSGALVMIASMLFGNWLMLRLDTPLWELLLR